MKTFILKNKKAIFFALILLNFGMVLVYNLLSPYFSDDYIFLLESQTADGFMGLVEDAVWDYMHSNSRFINHLTLRVLMHYFSKPVMDVISAILFVLLSFFIYDNIRQKEKYDIRILLMTFLSMWTFLAIPSDTFCWPSGTFTYLIGAVWIFGFISAFRHLLSRTTTKGTVIISILMFLLGIAAGMSNENASGGCFLILILFSLKKIYENKKHNIAVRFIFKPYFITSFLGILTGLILVLLSPGIHSRADVINESNFTGFSGLLSHIYKVTVSQKELFAPLFVLIAISLVTLTVQKRYKSFSDILTDSGIIFLFSGIAMSYVLALIEPPTDRAYFGSSICFIIALGILIENIDYHSESTKIARYSLLTILAIYICYDYSINLVNLFRIKREDNERIALIQNAVQNGESEVVVPQYRPEFETRFSAAHHNDMQEDPYFWINQFYENYYGIPQISAISRTEYDELYPQ